MGRAARHIPRVCVAPVGEGAGRGGMVSWSGAPLVSETVD